MWNFTIKTLLFIPTAGRDTWLERNLGVLIALAIVVLVGMSIFWVVRFGRKQSAQRLERARSLGFSPLGELVPDVLERVTHLYRSNQQQQIQLQNIFEQRRTDASFYLLDILDTAGDDTSNLGEEVIVIISSYLALPRFTIIPMIKMEGRLGGLMNIAIDKLMDMLGTRQGLERVQFDQYPEIDKRFIIFGDDPVEIRNFFTNSYMSGFFDIKPKYEIDAGGDTLIIKVMFPEQEKNRDEAVRVQFKDAEAIFHFFSQ